MRAASVKSPDIDADGRVTFRIRAPEARRVTVGGDVGQALPLPPGAPAFPPPEVVMERGADGVWTGTTSAPARAGAYRYRFNVDGVPVVDPSNPLTSPSQTEAQSLLMIPGDFSETRAVPHGTVSRVTYTAPQYGPEAQRSILVYTPPGYEISQRTYPVLYLLHGGGDTADSWMTVGRANDILDNLAAEGRIAPFILVALHGWTPQGPQPWVLDAAEDPLNRELTETIIPLVESRFRVTADAASLALSGLSMGGLQTLNIGMKNIDLFDYVLPMSAGLGTNENRTRYFAANRDALRQADEKLRLFWWGWGESDIAREHILEALPEVRRAGLTQIQTFVAPGGHDWSAWRAMLHEFAPKLFR